MKHYVMSDIHGMGDLFDEVIDFLETSGEYKLIYLGDAADRGKDGYRIMQHLLEMVSVDKCIYIKGNHEDLFVRAAYELKDDASREGVSLREYCKMLGGTAAAMSYGYDARLHYQNGGLDTVKEWIRDGASTAILSKLDKLPYHYTLDNIDFCHAGCTKEDWESGDRSSQIWSRDHFKETWYDNRILIHGHTSAKYLTLTPLKDENVIYPVRYNNKIDLDVTSFRTNSVVLYCIEDDNFIYITDKEDL